MAEVTGISGKPVRVVMWCVPRSASTIFAKCLNAIEGNVVWLEPYSYATLTRNLFYKSTHNELPIEYDGNEQLYDRAIALIESMMKGKMYPERLSLLNIKTDLEASTSKYVFVKDMSFAVNEWRTYIPSGYRHTFLIRDPSRVFMSAKKATSAEFSKLGIVPSDDKYDYSRDDPFGVEPQKIFKHQYELWRYVRENIDPNPIVIDANDLLSKPGHVLRAYCEAVGLPFRNSLLKWYPSVDESKGWRTAGEGVLNGQNHFYRNALQSTHFISPRESGPIPRDQLPPDIIECVNESMPYYTVMYESRLKV